MGSELIALKIQLNNNINARRYKQKKLYALKNAFKLNFYFKSRIKMCENFNKIKYKP